jgi:TP901 family phage tail tape measure protein
MAAASFEQEMANVNAVANLTGSEFDQLSQLALQIGQATSFSATEGAAAIGELAKAGVPVADILNGGAMAAANLAEAGGIGIPQAATAMSNSMNMFSLSGEQASYVADTFAAAANASAADVNGLSAALAQGGPSAAALGLSLDQTVAALALFSNYGIQGSDAGTSLKTMLASLTPTTAEATAALDAMGFSMDEMLASTDPMAYLAEKLQTGLEGMTAAQQQATLETIFGTDAQRVANVLFAEGAEGVSAMGEAVRDQGAASRMAAKRMDTLNGAIEQLKGSIETAMIIIGSAFIPIIRGFADGLLGVMDVFLNLSPGVQKFVGIALAAVGVFLGLGAAIGFLAPIMGSVIGLAFSMVVPFLTITAIIAGVIAVGVGLALMFRDEIGSAIQAVTGFVDGLILPLKLLWMYLGMVSDGTGRGAMSFALLPPAIQPAVRQIARLVDVFEVLKNAFERGGITGLLDALPGQLSRVGDAFGRLGSIILSAIVNLPWGDIGSALWNGLLAAIDFIGEVAGTIVSKLGNLTASLVGWLWQHASAVDWGGLLSRAAALAGDITGAIVSKLGNLAARLGSWLWEHASAVPWGTVLSTAAGAAGDITGSIVGKLGNLTARLASWLWEQASGVAWGTVLSTAAGAAGDITGTIVSKLGNLGTALLNWLTTAASGIPWANIANGVTDIVGPIISKIGNLAVGFKTWYDNAINSVDWGSLGNTIGTKVGNLAQTLAPKALELIQGLVTGIQNNWQTIITVIGGLVLGLPAAIGYLGLTLAPKAAEFIRGFVTGLGINWNTVINWLSGLPGKALAAVPGLTLTLLSKGAELLQGIITGLNQQWPTISAWLSLVGSLALAAIGSLLSTLLSKGVELIQGILDGINQHWATVAAWLGQAGALAFAAIGSLAATLLDRGVELIAGLAEGAANRWPDFQSDLADIASAAFEAVGSLASTLLSRGVELITGLATGAANRWPAFRQDLANIAQAAFAAVGSLASTLLSRGLELINGLRQGASNAWPGVRSDLAAIPGAAVSAVGELGSTLWNAGWSLISGLANGISAAASLAISAAQNIVNTVTDLLSNVPGFSPIEHVGLYYGEKLGFSFGEGIANSLKSNVRATSDMVNSVIDEMPKKADAALRSMAAMNVSSGQTVIYQNNQFDIHVDELEDVVEAARFVRDIDTNQTLYFEGVR